MTATMKKYADVVRAYLDGAEVQARWVGSNSPESWTNNPEPTWRSDFEYRIKPKEPRIVEKYAFVGVNFDDTMGTCHWIKGAYACPIKEGQYHGGDIFYKIVANIKIRCNEETGEVLSCELVQKQQ